MSVAKAPLSLPGAVARRSPAGRPRRGAAGLTRSRLRYLVPPLLALAVVVATQLIGQPGRPQLSDASITAPAAGSDLSEAVPGTEIAPLGSVDTADTDRRIAFWRERVASGSASENEWIYLGDLLDQKGRMTGDISQFSAAGDAYRTALEIAPASAAAHAGQARVLATLHDFPGALEAATRVLDLDPQSDGALSIVFDASIELGQMANAHQALTLLMERADTPAVTTRRARLAFLEGDSDAAATLTAQAAADSKARGDVAATLAFFEFTAAEYQLLAGRPQAAMAGYETALQTLPGYPPAMYGIGRAAYALGDLDTAVANLAAVAPALQRPDVLSFLADLYVLSGDNARADDIYAQVDRIADDPATGALFAHEYSIILADRGHRLDHALALAERDTAVYRDIYGVDALAWALHANGRDGEALVAIRSALAPGTADAKLLLHAGLIELANGLEQQGRAHLEAALALRPAISPLVVERARQALARLGR